MHKTWIIAGVIILFAACNQPAQKDSAQVVRLKKATPASSYLGNSTTSIDTSIITQTAVVDLVVLPPPPTPDFSVFAGPPTLSVKQGATATFMVTAPSIGGFNGVVTLFSVGSLPTLPAKSVVAFNPKTISGATSSKFTVKVDSKATIGTYTINISGMSNMLSHSTTVSLTVIKH